MPDQIVVWLRCPGCRYEFVGGIIIPGAWWAAECSPARTAGRMWCPKCEHMPPMDLCDELPFGNGAAP